MKIIRNIFILIIGVFVIIWGIRLCFLDIFNVPSESMENTLKPKDKIIIDKTIYSGLFSNILKELGLKTHLRRNDIVVFKLENSTNTYYVKRCIALPGQEIEIKDGTVKVERRLFIEDPNVRLRFKLWHHSFTKVENIFSRLRIDYFNSNAVRNGNYLVLDMNYRNARELQNSGIIDSLKIQVVDKNNNLKQNTINDTIPYSNLPRLIVPRKGMTINLNSQTFTLYKALIEKYEKVKIIHNNTFFSINGNLITRYTFKEDYVFVMGDNRNNSLDSRHFGPIPIINLTGKYLMTAFD